MRDNKEWMVQTWGGAWNADAEPSIEKDLGIKSGYHYFSTEEEKNAFIKLLNNPIYQKQGLMISVKEGNLTHKRTVFVGLFRYQDKEFILNYDFGYEYDEKDAVYMFEHGNYSCDCNRSLFIRNQYGEDAIPDLFCGWEIELVDYGFVYLD